ncbi:MAG: extracellular solute-binding protein [Anaerolineaceae bacterium]|nr:MAG: extracellular solute-binding protein [Anaerolineaceae bacterium]
MPIKASTKLKRSLLIIISLVATACSQQPTPTGPTPAAPVLAEIEGEPQRAEGDGRTEIVWLAPSEWSYLEYVVAEFEAQNPDIRVEIKQVSAESMFQEVENTLGVGSSSPDVVTFEASLSAYYGYNGWLESLRNDFTFDQKQDWIRASQMASIFNHEPYSAPITASTQLLFYNRDLFEQGRTNPPKQESRWTWERVMSAAEKLTIDEDDDGNTDVWGFAWENIGLAQLAPLAQSLSGGMVGDDGFTVEGMPDSVDWVGAFEFYDDMYAEKEVASASESFNAVESFERGHLGMLIADGTNIMRFAGVYTGTGLSFDWGVSLYPNFKKGEVSSPVGGWHIGININSRQKDAATRFVVWLTTGEGAETMWRFSTPGLPAQKSLLNIIIRGSEFDAEPWSYLRVAANQAMENLGVLPVTPGFPYYDALLQGMLQDIREGVDPERNLNSAVELISLAIEENQR